MRRIAGTVLLLTATLLPLAGCARDEADDADARVAARVDSLVAEYQRDTWAPGVSVAVVRGGRDTLVYRGYGLADVENGVPATPRTVYRIGSISKQFTAALVLQLAEQKRLSLDDPIGRYVMGLPEAWRGIRVRHLLNHTAGIPAFEIHWLRGGIREEALVPDSVIGLVRGEPLEFAPGTDWKYSNIGYTLLGMLIERVTDERYAHAVESRILRPLGLTATRYCDVTPLIPHRASGYQQRDTGVVNADYTSMTAPYAAGGLCSTVGDLAAWNRALATGRVVSAASLRRMTTPDSAAAEARYGYGLVVMDVGGHRVVRHNGGIQGFRADNAYLPDDSLSVTVLTNLTAPGPEELLLDILRAALNESPPKPARMDRTAAGGTAMLLLRRLSSRTASEAPGRCRAGGLFVRYFPPSAVRRDEHVGIYLRLRRRARVGAGVSRSRLRVVAVADLEVQVVGVQPVAVADAGDLLPP